MADRIDKMGHMEYWRVHASTETHKDRGQEEDKRDQEGKDAFSSLQDKTDWKLLLDKSSLWKRNIQILKEEIDKVLFKKINLRTDPSLLRVDILLKGGEKISPAFVSISRAVGLRIKNMNSGDPIPEDLILRDNVLRITIPANPELFAKEEALLAKQAKQRKTKKPAVSPPHKVEPKTAPAGEAEESTIRKKTSRIKDAFFRLRDPETKKFNPEMALIYTVAFLVVLLVIVGYFLLS